MLQNICKSYVNLCFFKNLQVDNSGPEGSCTLIADMGPFCFPLLSLPIAE